MITRVYIDNFRCFSNFEWEIGAFSLLLGDNGSGKSSVFEVIKLVAGFAVGLTDITSFGPHFNRSGWDKRQEQSFEIGSRSGEENFSYRVVIRYTLQGEGAEVVSETVHRGADLLYERTFESVRLYKDDGSPSGSFPFSGTRSVIGMMATGGEGHALKAFSDSLRNVCLFKPDPQAMGTVSAGDIRIASPNMEDLVGWLFHLGAMSADFSSRLLGDLKQVIPGLQTYSLMPAGMNARALQLLFKAGSNGTKGADFPLYLEQLSDGQRMLIAIYTILHGIVGFDSVVLLDEPDNFISSREMQPWIRCIQEKLDEHGGQVLLISHHPEVVNYLAPNNGALFYREENGPVRVKKFEWDGEDTLTPAEAIARGWVE